MERFVSFYNYRGEVYFTFFLYQISVSKRFRFGSIKNKTVEFRFLFSGRSLKRHRNNLMKTNLLNTIKTKLILKRIRFARKVK
ncbi:hypothetical protein LEP1GSC074_3095 [Leptospira noguchii str. Hook]|nr:hypothetical protein LEP1GSC041_0481 [Leptospira noguchii str. 2006001870]EMS88552.1 hypothetical protein LEP1GSC074_3095 [Leptospira noguchii str. Hook]